MGTVHNPSNSSPTPLPNIRASCYINTALQLLSQLVPYICVGDDLDVKNVLLQHIVSVCDPPNDDTLPHLTAIQKQVQVFRKFDKNMFDSPHTCFLALFTDPVVAAHIETLLHVEYVEHVRYTDTLFSTFQYIVHGSTSPTTLTKRQQYQMESFVDYPLSSLGVDDVGNIVLETINNMYTIRFIAPSVAYKDIQHLLTEEQQQITTDMMMNIYSMETLSSNTPSIGFVTGENTFRRKIRYAEAEWVPKNRFFILNSFIRDGTFKPPLWYKDGVLIGLGIYGCRHWIACIHRNKQWWKCDDDKITLIETDNIIEYVQLKLAPYMNIFYALYKVNQK